MKIDKRVIIGGIVGAVSGGISSYILGLMQPGLIKSIYQVILSIIFCALIFGIYKGIILINKSKTINKYKVAILWTLSIMAIIVPVIIAQYKPFSAKGSGIFMWFSFFFASLAIIIPAIGKKDINKIIFCIIGMMYITYEVILRFI